jgi:protein kinase C substrate 80K-H
VFLPADKRFYRERKSFLCIDGSKMILFEQVNDDYCDCDDGSDEPGESCGGFRDLLGDE